MSRVGAFRMWSGTGSAGRSRTSAVAASRATYTAFDLGASARYSVA